jgi:phage gpG-like protein
MRHRVSNNELALGTDRVYDAIHQFGGKIEHAARLQQVYFRQDKDGSVGNRFVQKRKSDFAQWVTRGAHSTDMPERAYLGLSTEDGAEIILIVQDYLLDVVERSRA